MKGCSKDKKDGKECGKDGKDSEKSGALLIGQNNIQEDISFNQDDLLCRELFVPELT